MKNYLIINLVFIAALFMPHFAQAQTPSIERIFETYSADENFSYVNISGQMLRLLASRSKDGETSMTSRLNRIRILSSSDLENETITTAFRDLNHSLMRQDYDELMEIRDAGSHFRFLMKGDDEFIEQLILVGYDKGSHVLISIEGRIMLSELSSISDTIPGLEGLKQLDDEDN
ncbi:MAG: DUF4252 domain-containing protein [Balneolaceae bacterium]|nr:MAG: DUF4252 domain-containing protein [Balneolaceae bacterium]